MCTRGNYSSRVFVCMRESVCVCVYVYVCVCLCVRVKALVREIQLSSYIFCSSP